MRLIDADELLTDRRKTKYYHLPNKDIAVPIIDIEHAHTVNAIPIPDGATNGDMIKDIFPSEVWLQMKAREFNKTWWNAPYEGGKEK